MAPVDSATDSPQTGVRRFASVALAVVATGCGGTASRAVGPPATATVAPSTTVPLPTLATTTTVGRPAPTTTVKIQPTTTAPSTTVPIQPPVTTYKDPGLPTCDPGSLRATARTDAPSYARGAPVGLSATVTNT